MTTQRHGETERRHEGFEARLEQLWEWLEANRNAAMAAGAALLVLGGAVAAFYEWSQSSAVEAQLALDEVEWTYLEAMGGSRDDLVVVEPANEDQARRAREQALAGYEAVIEEHGGAAADMARIRAADMEIGLGRLDAAEQRLAAAAEEASSDLLRGSALRLRGFALEELERPLDAAAAYETAAGVEGYPAREDLWVAAADARRRGGDPAGAAADLREALAIAPEYAEQLGLVERLESLEAMAAAQPPPAESSE